MSALDAEIARLSRRVRDDPRSTAFVGLAEALRRARRLTEALQTLRAGFRVHPDHPAGRVVLARVHVDAGQAALATDVLRDVLRGHPENIGATSLLARLYLEAGRRADAEPLLKCLRLAGHPDAALVAGSAAPPIEPDLRCADPFDHPGLAQRFARAGHYARAQALWRRIAACHPDAAAPRARLAELDRALAGLSEVAGRADTVQTLGDAERLPDLSPRGAGLRRFAASLARI